MEDFRMEDLKNASLETFGRPQLGLEPPRGGAEAADFLGALQRLIGLHRTLLELVRSERDALLGADLKLIHEATLAKEAVIEQIRAVEAERARSMAAFLAAHPALRGPGGAPTLTELLQGLEPQEPALASRLQSARNALQLLVTRILEQSAGNRAICERTLGHLERMKKNVLGEASPHSERYSQQGQRVGAAPPARLVSREA
jgi:hypothetical protein